MTSGWPSSAAEATASRSRRGNGAPAGAFGERPAQALRTRRHHAVPPRDRRLHQRHGPRTPTGRRIRPVVRERTVTPDMIRARARGPGGDLGGRRDLFTQWYTGLREDVAGLEPGLFRERGQPPSGADALGQALDDGLTGGRLGRVEGFGGAFDDQGACHCGGGAVDEPSGGGAGGREGLRRDSSCPESLPQVCLWAAAGVPLGEGEGRTRTGRGPRGPSRTWCLRRLAFAEPAHSSRPHRHDIHFHLGLWCCTGSEQSSHGLSRPAGASCRCRSCTP